jgi:hypothetical protein
MVGFNIPANKDLDIVQSPEGYIFPAFSILHLAFLVMCRICILISLSDVHSVQFRLLFSGLGQTHSLSGHHTPLNIKMVFF